MIASAVPITPDIMAVVELFPLGFARLESKALASSNNLCMFVPLWREFWLTPLMTGLSLFWIGDMIDLRNRVVESDGPIV